MLKLLGEVGNTYEGKQYLKDPQTHHIHDFHVRSVDFLRCGNTRNRQGNTKQQEDGTREERTKVSSLQQEVS